MMSCPTREQIVSLAPQNTSSSLWTTFLGRYLSHNELHMLEALKCEIHINRMLSELYQRCNKKRLYVPHLTTLVGNCLFESLNYHNIGKTPEEIRKSLAFFFYQFRDHQHLFPDDIDTLQQRFDIEKIVLPDYVFCLQNKKMYRLKFDTMCQDLVDDGSWSKLPANTLMVGISFLFQLRIIVVKNTNIGEGDSIVDVWEKAPPEIQANIKTIYLGQLSESHYVPLDVLAGDEEIDPLLYTKYTNLFMEWSNKQIDIVYARVTLNYNRTKEIEDRRAKQMEMMRCKDAHDTDSSDDDKHPDSGDHPSTEDFVSAVDTLSKPSE